METARVWLKQVISLLEGRYPALAWYTKTFPSMSLISAAPPPEINTHAIDLAKPNSHEAVQYAIKYWEHLEAGAKYKVFEACKKYVCELLAYAVAVNVPLSPNDMNMLQSWISNAVHRNGVTEEVMKGRCQALERHKEAARKAYERHRHLHNLPILHPHIAQDINPLDGNCTNTVLASRKMFWIQSISFLLSCSQAYYDNNIAPALSGNKFLVIEHTPMPRITSRLRGASMSSTSTPLLLIMQEHLPNDVIAPLQRFVYQHTHSPGIRLSVEVIPCQEPQKHHQESDIGAIASDMSDMSDTPCPVRSHEAPDEGRMANEESVIIISSQAQQESDEDIIANDKEQQIVTGKVAFPTEDEVNKNAEDVDEDAFVVVDLIIKAEENPMSERELFERALELVAKGQYINLHQSEQSDDCDDIHADPTPAYNMSDSKACSTVPSELSIQKFPAFVTVDDVSATSTEDKWVLDDEDGSVSCTYVHRVVDEFAENSTDFSSEPLMPDPVSLGVVSPARTRSATRGYSTDLHVTPLRQKVSQVVTASFPRTTSTPDLTASSPASVRSVSKVSAITTPSPS